MAIETIQSEINKAEAGSSKLFVAGWRPFIGWVCGFGLFYHFLFQPIFSDLFQKPIATSNSYETTIQGLLVLCDIAEKKVRSIQDLKAQNREHNLLKTIEPRESMKLKMLSRYQTWQKLYKQFND